MALLVTERFASRVTGRDGARLNPAQNGSPARRTVGRALLVLGVVLLLALVAAATWWVLSAREAPERETPAVLVFDRDGMRFTYQVVTGSAGLFDLAQDPYCLKDLTATRPDVSSALRRELEAQLGVKSLEELRSEAAREQAQRLSELGY